MALFGFIINDRGKSEQLLAAAQPAAALGRYSAPPQGITASLAAARRAALLAHARRIASGQDDGQTAREAPERAAEYGRLVQEARGQRAIPQPSDPSGDFAKVTEGLATRNRAVAHLSLIDGLIAGFWADGARTALKSQWLRLEDVDVSELAAALARPEYDTLPILEGDDGAGVRVGRPLAEQAARRGVRELVLCPTRLLHGLPFGALRIDAGDRERRPLDRVPARGPWPRGARVVFA